MTRLFVAIIMLASATFSFFIFAIVTSGSKPSASSSYYRTTYSPTYCSQPYDEPELEELLCPIPMKDRVPNYTRIQCVYSSIEMLGRWAEEPKLTNPPLTSRQECQGKSGPYEAANILKRLGVRFEQSTNRETALALLKKAMAEGRGCLWGVSRHAMVLVHYDEKANKVCWVDNSDSSLRVQTTTIPRFEDRWENWILVIYADKDVIPYKLARGPMFIPILDQEAPSNTYPPDTILMPKWRA